MRETLWHYMACRDTFGHSIATHFGKCVCEMRAQRRCAVRNDMPKALQLGREIVFRIHCHTCTCALLEMGHRTWIAFFSKIAIHMTTPALQPTPLRDERYGVSMYFGPVSHSCTSI